MGLLFKLLRQNISIVQVLGFLLVNLIGGVIVLSGIQAAVDFDSFSGDGDQLLSGGTGIVILLAHFTGYVRVFRAVNKQDWEFARIERIQRTRVAYVKIPKNSCAEPHERIDDFDGQFHACNHLLNHFFR